MTFGKVKITPLLNSSPWGKKTPMSFDLYNFKF